MSNDQGALNKIEHGEFAAAWNDIEVSLKAELGEGASLAVLALKTFGQQFATPFGAQALNLALTAGGDVVQGQTVPQIAAVIEPQITADAISDAEKAGEVTLNAVRVALTTQVPAAADPTSSPADTAAPADTSAA